jgi:hypothetical protein
LLRETCRKAEIFKIGLSGQKISREEKKPKIGPFFRRYLKDEDRGTTIEETW